MPDGLVGGAAGSFSEHRGLKPDMGTQVLPRSAIHQRPYGLDGHPRLASRHTNRVKNRHRFQYKFHIS